MSREGPLPRGDVALEKPPSVFSILQSQVCSRVTAERLFPLSSNATAKERERLTFRDVQSPQEFRHGETAEVVCDVISSPVPVVVWYYQDKEITEEHHSRFQVLPNNNLQIHQVTKADEGVYRCEASVEARGEIDFVDIAMVVNVPPVLSVFQPAFNATADYQESVTFTCMTSGSPDPLVTWHRYVLLP
ncbi:hypothetical protein KUCAC02_033407 [Chaenocephalus aceratus]|nr:hypothetical protein KUCAC02_033407 [Chaenocephalus aceratus]